MTNPDQWQQRVKQTLDRQSVDEPTRDALRAARTAALDGVHRPALPRWGRAAAFATLLLAVAAVIVFDNLQNSGFPRAEADDLAVIASDDDFELYEELEFYVWFDEDDSA